MISHYLADGGVFVDIGANIGYYALNAALLGAEKVIAIEPNPKILARLNDNIALNNLSSNISVHDVAVGDKKGVVKLTIADSDFGSSSIVDHSVGTNHVSVPILPLLEILKTETVGTASVIKIDIEGMEDRALFPYFEAIKPENYPKLIVMEDGINSHWERDILSWLLANGYESTARTRGNVMLTLTNELALPRPLSKLNPDQLWVSGSLKSNEPFSVNRTHRRKSNATGGSCNDEVFLNARSTDPFHHQ